jgi:hypothetical protein
MRAAEPGDDEFTDENQSPKNATSPPASHQERLQIVPRLNPLDMLREQALALQRPSNFHNEQKKRKMGKILSLIIEFGYKKYQTAKRT